MGGRVQQVAASCKEFQLENIHKYKCGCTFYVFAHVGGCTSQVLLYVHMYVSVLCSCKTVLRVIMSFKCLTDYLGHVDNCP